jgi:hypothetical protein
MFHEMNREKVKTVSLAIAVVLLFGSFFLSKESNIYILFKIVALIFMVVSVSIGLYDIVRDRKNKD